MNIMPSHFKIVLMIQTIQNYKLYNELTHLFILTQQFTNTRLDFNKLTFRKLAFFQLN